MSVLASSESLDFEMRAWVIDGKRICEIDYGPKTVAFDHSGNESIR